MYSIYGKYTMIFIILHDNSVPLLLLSIAFWAWEKCQDVFVNTWEGISFGLGNIAPDFSCETTHGHWGSFHEWKKGKWCILFSHPADFTPVCTTEIGRLALKYDDLTAMDCLLATLSVDPVKSHQEWLDDVVAHCENEIEVCMYVR